MSNSDYTILSEEQREKIIKYTGIRFRRWAPQELCCSDLCQAAAEKLMGEMGWERESIGAVVFISQTSDYPFPATAQNKAEQAGTNGEDAGSRNEKSPEFPGLSVASVNSLAF